MLRHEGAKRAQNCLSSFVQTDRALNYRLLVCALRSSSPGVVNPRESPGTTRTNDSL
jgi:hypothetical protein